MMTTAVRPVTTTTGRKLAFAIPKVKAARNNTKITRLTNTITLTMMEEP